MSLNKITDKGLKEVAQLQQLTSLNLSGCFQITNAGLKELAKLQKLNSVHVGGPFTKITDTAMTELKMALPNCKINR